MRHEHTPTDSRERPFFLDVDRETFPYARPSITKIVVETCECGAWRKIAIYPTATDDGLETTISDWIERG